jgi:hypothetical protein
MIQIVIAWTEEEIQIVKTRRTDLGEQPVTRSVQSPRACMWLASGTDEDLARARAWAARENKTVFTFPTSEPDPLGQAKIKIMTDGP